MWVRPVSLKLLGTSPVAVEIQTPLWVAVLALLLSCSFLHPNTSPLQSWWLWGSSLSCCLSSSWWPLLALHPPVSWSSPSWFLNSPPLILAILVITCWSDCLFLHHVPKCMGCIFQFTTYMPPVPNTAPTAGWKRLVMEDCSGIQGSVCSTSTMLGAKSAEGNRDLNLV